MVRRTTESEPMDPATFVAPPDDTGRGHFDWTDRHERVLGALTAAEEERGGEAPHLEQIARRAGLGEDETRRLLHDLVRVHRMAAELAGSDRPDPGPRHETTPPL
ncbi:hypothetical protein [Streptomyces galbus]|uniref:MarR family transcriptional regulator n=1 Tax=Streptomyces galbus TaxID=33898 RepID=A0ABX1IGA9_STRGB|nr:hypothetical protein [Streptomyces galbus]NKQ24706.1 hypothetical protein [Streptomyces galbus]